MNINSANSIFSSTIYQIGQKGPLILIFITIYLLWSKGNSCFYYVVGCFLNSIINLILKGIIKHPRPSEDIEKFNTMVSHGKRFIFKDNGFPHDIYGMPSGHAQSCLFSTIFVYLTLKNPNILIFYLIITGITIYQRVKYQFHTLFQTVVGSICGIIFGYYIYYLTNQKAKGKIREKSDDFGPI